MSYLVGVLDDRFSHNKALMFHMIYRRRSPGKFGKDKKKKKLKHLEEGEDDSSNKLIKFGSLPSYK